MADVVVICLIGITGEGKSTTAGRLCDNPHAFKTSAGAKSETKTCKHTDFVHLGITYRLIDTVGFFDTNLTPAAVNERLSQFADLAPQGVDVFLFTCRRGRFLSLHIEALKSFVEACNASALAHTGAIFTHLEEVENTEFLGALKDDETEVPNLAEFLKMVDNRVVGVENKIGGEVRRKKDCELVLEMVQKILDANMGQRYSSDQMKKAEAWRTHISEQAELLTPSHAQTIRDKLEELLHGRCKHGRMEVEEKLKELQDAEEESRKQEQRIAAAQQAKAAAEHRARQAEQNAERSRLLWREENAEVIISSKGRTDYANCAGRYSRHRHAGITHINGKPWFNNQKYNQKGDRVLAWNGSVWILTSDAYFYEIAEKTGFGGYHASAGSDLLSAATWKEYVVSVLAPQ